MSRPTGGLPLEVKGIENHIERTYRDGGQYQWAREIVQNSLEANATKVWIGTHWPSVEAEGVHRLMFVDDGIGMDPDELVGFFRSYGAGGKMIGGYHDNFGIGAKTSTLPWNQEGVVVISRKEGYDDPAMIRIYKEIASNDYRLEVFTDTDGKRIESTVPSVDGYGTDWGDLHEYMQDHGTAVILMGNSRCQHTIFGDPERDPHNIKGVSQYLNLRYFDFPKTIQRITVEEYIGANEDGWPKNRMEAHHNQVPGKLTVFRRQIRGARTLIEDPRQRDEGEGQLGGSGTITLPDDTKVHWWLWQGKRTAKPHFTDKGFIAALYRNELYDMNSLSMSYRTFGIPYVSIAKRLWIVVEPPELAAGRTGIYPTSDRSYLRIQGGARAGTPLPYHEWGAKFRDDMPQVLAEEIEKIGSDAGSLDDEAYKTRLANRFGNRWKLASGVISDKPDVTIKTDIPTGIAGRRPRKRTESDNGSGGGNGSNGHRGGDSPAFPIDENGTGGKKRKHDISIPTGVWVSGAEMEHPRYGASWCPPNSLHPSGLVSLNEDHSVVQSQIKHWLNECPDVHQELVRHTVKNVYREAMVAKIAHMMAFSNQFTPTEINNELCSPFALTTALLGLFAEDAVISSRIKSRITTKRKGAAAD